MKYTALLPLLLVLAACTSTPYNSPIVDRLPSRSLDPRVSSDGYYTVKPGDTLYRIALDFGLDWRELARANGISDPSGLAIGQKLLVEGISGGALATADSGVGSDSSSSGVEVKPIQGGTAAGGVARPIAIPTPASPEPPETPKPAVSRSDFVWPHNGTVIENFKPGKNKGIDLAAKIGDPVIASSAGKVVYAGNALRGYGNLVIIKHPDNLLTAYAHNQTLLVKEGDQVQKGQRIAEAGQSDASRPMLHFEVRKQGKPVNPLDYLPSR